MVGIFNWFFSFFCILLDGEKKHQNSQLSQLQEFFAFCVCNNYDFINDLVFLSSGKNHALFATHGTLVCFGLILYSIGSKHIPAAELTLLSLTEVNWWNFWVWLPFLELMKYQIKVL